MDLPCTGTYVTTPIPVSILKLKLLFFFSSSSLEPKSRSSANTSVVAVQDFGVPSERKVIFLKILWEQVKSLDIFRNLLKRVVTSTEGPSATHDFKLL